MQACRNPLITADPHRCHPLSIHPPIATLDAREEFFTGTLQHAQRMVNSAEAIWLQLLLAGFEAMLLEEQAQTGSFPRMDDPVVRGFFMHQANELRVTQFDIDVRRAPDGGIGFRNNWGGTQWATPALTVKEVEPQVTEDEEEKTPF